jgi:hypothetical protein
VVALVKRATDARRGATVSRIVASSRAFAGFVVVLAISTRAAAASAAEPVPGSAPAPAPHPTAPEPEPAAPPVLGAWAPMWQPSPITDVLWTSPTAPDAASLGAGVSSSDGSIGVTGQARASVSVGPVGLEAAIRTPSTAASAPNSAGGWLGVRGRILRLGAAELEIAPVLRLGLPATSGAPARIEPSVAIGGAEGRVTWLLDLGGRVRLAEDTSGATPATHGFALLGASLDPVSWLRAYALVDAHLLANGQASREGRGGLTLGLEVGEKIFGGAGLRVGPWHEPGAGVVSGQLSIGIRAWR